MNAPDLPPIRVLLVDDHRTTLWGLALLINGEARLRVEGMASNGEEALHLAERLQPDFIVLDLDLNGDSSFDLMGRLQALCAARIVILTGLGDATRRAQAKALGAYEFLHKDESADVLLDTLLSTR